MKRLLYCLLAFTSILTGCKPKPTLHLYCWADYIAPELIQKFEKENGCRVVYDTFDSNEAMAAKLQAGATGYDVIFPSHYVVDSLVKAGKLAELDKSQLYCLSQLDEKTLDLMPDKECRWSVPYAVSYTGIGYDTSKVQDFKTSWKQFERTDLQRRATLLDDKREVIGAALLSLGLDPNSTADEDLAKAKEVIRGWTKNVNKFENEQYKNGLASGEFFLVMGYSGDLIQIIEENPRLAFAIPEEGALMSCDVMVIPATAPHPELAYKFINFIHDPVNAAKNMEYTQYFCPNKGAYPLVSEELKSNPGIFISEEARSKSKFIMDQGADEVKFNKLWEDVKAGK